VFFNSEIYFKLASWN